MAWSLPHQANKGLNPANPVSPLIRPSQARNLGGHRQVTHDLTVAFSTPPEEVEGAK
jgi:hypothetical protein